MGIGTSSPAEILEAVASSPTVCIRDTQTSITTAKAALRLAESGAGNSVDNYWDLVADNTAGNFGFSIKEGTDTRFAIKAGNGNCGIGTSSPDAPLEVVRSSTGEVELARFRIEGQTNNPMLRFHSDESQKVLTIGTSGSVSGTQLAFDTQSGEAARFDASGRMGIGSTSPDEPLDVRGGAYNANQDFGIQLGVTTGQWKSGFKIKSDSGGIPRIAIEVPANATGGTTEVLSLLGGTSTGLLGIGTSSPGSLLHVSNGNDAASGEFIGLTIGGTNVNNARTASLIKDTTTYDLIYKNNNFSSALGNHIFKNGNSEHMRIDSSGTLLVGRTANTDTGALCVDQDVSGGNVGISTITANTGSRFHLLFRNGNGQVGSIATNGSATSFNTSSDYRLKENVVDLDGAIDRVKQLAPRRFNFIADADTTVDGFLAHEAQTVVPEAVTGTHNEVDGDGNAVMQGIDQSKLVPLLTAALKEAIAKIETLETKVAALEAAN